MNPFVLARQLVNFESTLHADQKPCTIFVSYPSSVGGYTSLGRTADWRKALQSHPMRVLCSQVGEAEWMKREVRFVWWCLTCIEVFLSFCGNFPKSTSLIIARSSVCHAVNNGMLGRLVNRACTAPCLTQNWRRPGSGNWNT